MMNDFGFCAISSIEKENNLLALAITENVAIPDEKSSIASVWIILLAIVLIAGFIVTGIVRSIRKTRGKWE